MSDPQPRTLSLCRSVLWGSRLVWLFATFSRGPWSWPIWLHCTGTPQSGLPQTRSTQSIFWIMESWRKGNPFYHSHWVSCDEKEWDYKRSSLRPSFSSLKSLLWVRCFQVAPSSMTPCCCWLQLSSAWLWHCFRSSTQPSHALFSDGVFTFLWSVLHNNREGTETQTLTLAHRKSWTFAIFTVFLIVTNSSKVYKFSSSKIEKKIQRVIGNKG